MHLLKTDKELMKALGITQRSPYMASCNAFDYIARARNKVVDDLIMSHSSSSDPMADNDGPSMQLLSSHNRSKAFGAAGVGNIVLVTFDGFTTEEGKVVRPIQANVLSTPSRAVSPNVECTPEVLDWLVHAVYMDWFELCPDLFHQNSTSKRALPAWLPELESPLSYSMAGGKLSVVVSYRNEKGMYTRKRRAVEDILGADEQVNLTIITNVASALMKFYEKNHHDKQEDAAQDAATALATDD